MLEINVRLCIPGSANDLIGKRFPSSCIALQRADSISSHGAFYVDFREAESMLKRVSLPENVEPGFSPSDRSSL